MTKKKQSRRKRQPDTFSGQLRALIDGCGMTRYELAKRTGVSQSQLSRFMAGTHGLSTSTLDALAAELGWEAVQRQAKRS